MATFILLKSLTLTLTLTHFHTYRSEFDCFQIELAKNYGMTEWRDDLRNVMMKAGLENKPVVFLFSDTQVEVLQRLLNSSREVQT